MVIPKVSNWSDEKKTAGPDKMLILDCFKSFGIDQLSIQILAEEESIAVYETL